MFADRTQGLYSERKVLRPNMSVRRPNSVVVCRPYSVFADRTESSQTELSVGCSQTELGVWTSNVSADQTQCLHSEREPLQTERGCSQSELGV